MKNVLKLNILNLTNIDLIKKKTMMLDKIHTEQASKNEYHHHQVEHINKESIYKMYELSWNL
jgi:hypothetical protein